MSCERNSNSAGGAGIKNGITRLANKAGNTLGAIQSGYARTMDIYNDQVTRRVAPATNNILARVDRPTSTAAAVTSRVATSQVFPFVVTAAVMFRPGFDTRVNKIVLVPTSRETRGAVSDVLRTGMDAKNAIEKFVVMPSKALAGLVVGATRERKGTVLTLKQGKRELASVSFVKAPKVTRFLNRIDLAGSNSQGKAVILSHGEIVRAGLTAGEREAFKRKAATNLATTLMREVAIEQVKKVSEQVRGQTGLVLEGGTGMGKERTAGQARQERLVKAGTNFMLDMTLGKGNGNDYWHRGTTVFKTLRGDTRTMTHLQSLGIPAQHYYFDRELAQSEVAEIVTGMKQAHHVPGYAGGIHPLEGLTPLWGKCKRGMITARLYYPPDPAKWVKQETSSELREESK